MSLALLLPCMVGLAVGLHLAHRHALLRVVASLSRSNSGETPPEPTLDLYQELEAQLRKSARKTEQARFEKVQGNIRLLGLGEMWRSLAGTTDVESIFESILRYCRHEGHFREVALLRIEPESELLAGRWFHPGMPPGASLPVRWGLGGLGGVVRDILMEPRSVLRDHDPLAPVLTINRERPGTRTEFEKFAIVPIMAPKPRSECIDEGWLYRRGCPAFEPNDFAHGRSEQGALRPCLNCRHFPVYGALIVTDAGREQALRPADLLMLEALASALGALWEQVGLQQDMRTGTNFRERILESMESGLISTDPRGKLSFANRQALEFCGVDDEKQLLGRHVDELFHFADTRCFARVMGEGRPARHQDAKLFSADHPDGHRPVRVNLAPILDADQKREGAVLVFEDLSGVRAMEEEIRQLDNLAAVGRFASSMAHEIRNPLGGISAGIHFLSSQHRLHDEDRKSLSVVEGEIERIDQLIGELLGVARPRSLQLERETPAAIAQRALSVLQGIALERSIEIRMQPDPHAPEIEADADMLHQIVLNLLKNAIELSPEGSSVELATMRAREGERDGVAFEIRDRGPGFSREDLEMAFEPFYSRRAGGSGLGLYVCHNFAERHGGRLRANNREGGGAVLRLFLPLVPALSGGSA